MLKSALPITKVTLVWVTPFHQLCYSAQLEAMADYAGESYLENTIPLFRCTYTTR